MDHPKMRLQLTLLYQDVGSELDDSDVCWDNCWKLSFDDSSHFKRLKAQIHDVGGMEMSAVDLVSHRSQEDAIVEVEEEKEMDDTYDS